MDQLTREQSPVTGPGTSQGVGADGRQLENEAARLEAGDGQSEQEGEGGSEPPPPYFPPALAVSKERPLEFNFELYLFDTLQLSQGLFPADRDGPVDFPSLTECRSYCERFVQQEIGAQVGVADERHTLAQEMRDRLDKEAMFRQSGVSLSARMITGNGRFDANLDNLRVDCFGNLMLLGAPVWSDLSPQFTHGYPRRLIAETHGGILPGNLTVAARISNQAIRSLSTGDVAAFSSRGMVQGLGLTKAELMLARTSAIKYAGKREKPARLIDLMVRFGIDFLSLAPLTVDQTKTLRESSSAHWSRVLSSAPADASDSEGSSSDGSGADTAEVSVGWDPRQECEMLPARSSLEYNKAMEMTLGNLFTCYTSTSLAVQATVATVTETRPVQRSAQPRSSSHSGQRRKRPRANPPERAEASNTGSAPDPSVVSAEEDRQQQHDAREALLAMPGIMATRIPNQRSLVRLEEFLRKNQPIDPRVSQAI